MSLADFLTGRVRNRGPGSTKVSRVHFISEDHAVSKTVLLARPHPFIVQEMKPLLEQCGFGVLKPDSFADLDTQARRCNAAVISLALISDIEASAEDVMASIHRVNPKLPIIFASLLPFERAVSTISGLLDKLRVDARVIGVSNSTDSPQSPTTTLSVLYLAKEDLTNPVVRERARQLLLRQVG